MKSSRVFIAIFTLVLLQACAPTLPEATTATNYQWLEQNWTAKERHWFHHASQGTATLPVPYKWFVSLEQPTLGLRKQADFKDSQYLSRFGFIPSSEEVPTEPGYSGQRKYGSIVYYSEKTYAGNPDGLPVGFAKTEAKHTLEKTDDLIGFTCAACHTGHMEYKETSIRIDGGPAITNLGKFREALVLALAYTKYVPFRFDRFADKVLEADHTEADRDRLKAKLDARLDAILAVAGKLKELDKDAVEEGFARLDALNRIGNQVFVTNFLNPPKFPESEKPKTSANCKLPEKAPKEGFGFDPWDNYRTTNAPVNFPHIWSTSWFDWVQYDASIKQPMVRNAGEALGVSAQLNIAEPTHPLYDSSVLVRDVRDMEKLLAGDNPFLKTNGQPEEDPHFKGLRAPKWPDDLFGGTDEDKVANGRKLYMELCMGCHGHPVNEDTGNFWKDGKRWTPPNDVGERYYKVKPVIDVGTDPAQGEVLLLRSLKVPKFLGLKFDKETEKEAEGRTWHQKWFGTALAETVQKTADCWYDDNGIIDEKERAAWNGNRENEIQAGVGYKARPLNGIWATAPFLHNGSVPNLYSLLLPADERPKKFCLGNRKFDPVKVGYVFEEPPCPPGTFELDTTIPGNSNAGHEFTDALAYGFKIVGNKRLTEAQRWDLIEYLKTL